MGVPTGGGQNLGNAQGRISIDTSSVRAAQAEVARASQQMQGSFTNLGGSLQQVGRFLGITFGAATVAQIGRVALQADAMATAYRRQAVAATNLAGSQEQLNDLLRTYDQATGGAIDQATALGNVTQLLAVGFADSTEELDRFARAIRGISVAMGRSQEFVTQNLILELFSQRGMRLDQLGLQYDQVRQRADELRAADASLTQQMAYQQAVLEQAEKRFGALTKSMEGQATGVERAAKAWADLRLELAQEIKPNVDEAGNDIANLLELFVRLRREMQRLSEQAQISRMRQEGVTGPLFRDPVPSWMTSSGTPLAPTVAPRFRPDEEAAIREWAREIQDIERQANRDRIDATRQYEQQRSDVIRNYGKQIAREAEDFARQRARSEQDYAISLQRMWRDIAQREARQLADLERTITEARVEAAERASERLADYEERVVDMRAAAQERIVELESGFAKQRERDQRAHARRLRDAAANLDAVAIRDAQLDFAERRRDAQEDFDERLAKERANEAKRLAELEKAYAKQSAADAKALDKRIRQSNDAYVRQLEDARAADAQRLEDMNADQALRQAREDEDRATRLRRMAEDFSDQLAQMDRQHAERMAELDRQEQEALQSAQDAFDEEMAALGQFHGDYRKRTDEFYKESIELYDRYLDSLEGAILRREIMGTTIPFRPGVTPLPSTSSGAGTTTRNSSVTVGQITIVTPTNFATDARSRAWLEEALADILDDYAEGR